MEIKTATETFSALAHESRLAIFRFLVTQGPGGATAGAIAGEFGMPGGTLNFHLEQLVGAGLVQRHRQGRNIHYAAVYAAVDTLIEFLTENCCAADPKCQPQAAGAKK